MIPKGNGGDFRGIGLLEVLWKTIPGLLNHRFTMSIYFHDLLHDFGADRGTWTTTLEAKLLQQLMATREAVLQEIFLNLQKAYDSLDWYRRLKIFAEYNVGPRELHLIWMSWGRITMVAKSGGYHAPPFKICHSITQRYPLSLTIFNMVMDAVIHHWVKVVASTEAGV